MSCLLQKTRMSDVDSLITFFSLFSLKWNLSLFFSPKPNLDLPRRTFQRICIYKYAWMKDRVCVCMCESDIDSLRSLFLSSLLSLACAKMEKNEKAEMRERELRGKKREKIRDFGEARERQTRERREEKKGRKTHSSSSSLFLSI